MCILTNAAGYIRPNPDAIITALKTTIVAAGAA